MIAYSAFDTTIGFVLSFNVYSSSTCSSPIPGGVSMNNECRGPQFTIASISHRALTASLPLSAIGLSLVYDTIEK